MKFGDVILGDFTELTTKEVGAEKANISSFDLYAPDVPHHHNIAEETYFCTEGEGEIYSGVAVRPFKKGMRAIIPPGTVHAVRPKTRGVPIKFICVSSPPFDPDDVVVEEPRNPLWFHYP